MIVLVDGHNALARLGIDRPDHGAERDELVRRVRDAAGAATVVFDGFPPPGMFAGTEERGVAVRFSLDREADEVIVEVVRDTARGPEVLVVTDDRELAARVRQLGARTASVARFFAPRRRPEVHDVGAEKEAAGGDFKPSDFGLPDTLDLDDPRLRRDE